MRSVNVIELVYEPGDFLDFNGRRLYSYKQPHVEVY